MAHLSPLPLGQIFRPAAPGQGFGMSAEAQHGRQANGRRNVFSTVTQRIGTIRGMNRDAMRDREGSRLDRLLQEINRMRDAAIGPTGTFPHQPDSAVDLEAQNAAAANESNGRRGGTNSTGKNRREKEEGAALFGPNLANYFGSGSSSSGAVISTIGADHLTSLTASQKRSRLGSRGRARGASLSGLSVADAPAEVHGSQEESFSQQKNSVGADAIAMAEGIEIDTIKRWIDRSVVGGALEVPNADNTAAASVETVGASTLCSTLQSYVNLKRNTVKLNVHSDVDGDSAKFTVSTPGGSSPAPTHLLQFEYDCASPFAAIQIFARASRKHGSWVNWAAAREAAGQSSDTCLDPSDDVDSFFYAQRGPPPHVLGWPIYSNRLTRGFAKPLKAGVALQLDFYAPPKNDQMSKRTEEAFGGNREVETPGLEVAKRLGEEPTTPAVATVPIVDPMSREETNATVTATPPAVPTIETKESKAAREKAERETLKITVIVEALDEDGKPFGEPNLQTTYLRVASLPLRAQDASQGAVLDASNVLVDGREGGPVQDVALPLEEEGTEMLSDGPVNTTQPGLPARSSSRRVWSLQVEGQEAEIGPHRFQLQELYGLSSRPPPPQQENHQDQELVEGDTDNPAPLVIDYNQEGAQSECLICLSAPPTTLLLPCTHGLCLECAVQLRESVKTVRQTERRRGRRPKRKYACPVCRRAYTNMLHLSTADEKKVAQANAPIS